MKWPRASANNGPAESQNGFPGDSRDCWAILSSMSLNALASLFLIDKRAAFNAPSQVNSTGKCWYKLSLTEDVRGALKTIVFSRIQLFDLVAVKDHMQRSTGKSLRMIEEITWI